MRMWMIDPSKMCNSHLLGEHYELHKLDGCLTLKRNISGYIKLGQLAPRYILERHHELVKEMYKRGFNHNSPIKIRDFSRLPKGKIDVEHNLDDLAKRCKKCAVLINNIVVLKSK